ncbi:hypothetical protein EDB81DRAFT_809170 [Dactylonectria macrodidyma]|uniref:Zn(2)-C6 fungal-type domain-containing protein n=1 Tax=Dactylonectria macrodidyma TaxID=307937 RepID=A0A9P9DVQ7_9HYPO|nr:hypothetical protein EDB81DRAFT_809170 [Dactylonectria macrodidyma]
MFFPGTLSSGCSRCRKRRIKCDGKRPGCRRCEIYQTTCPGYDQSLVVPFHAEQRSSFFQGPAVGTSSQPQPAPTDLLALTRDRVRRMSVSVNPNPTRQPQPSFEDESIAFFLQEHCIQPEPGPLRGHLEFLQEMYQSSNHDTCLRQATLATAYMSLSRHYKSSQLYFTARAHYGLALRAVNRDLTASSKTLKDETLVSIMFLGMMEDIDCEGSGAKAVHMLGISRLYEFIGYRLLNSVHKSSLDAWIFTELQIPSLNASKDLDCLAIPDTNLETSNPTIHMALIVTRIGQFYRLAKRLTSPEVLKGQAQRRSQLLSAIQQAMDIQSELIKIAGALPSQWKRQETEDKRQANAESPPLASGWIACLGCGFNAHLILFFSRFLSCCRTLVQLDYRTKKLTPETHLAETSMPLAEAQLRRLTATVCATMPYLMGEVNEQGTSIAVPQQKAVIMYRLIWPLAIVIGSPHSTSQQIENCQTRLNWIRDRYGIKLASVAPDLVKELMP